MAQPKYHTGPRGYPGYEIALTSASGVVSRTVIPAVALVDESGNAVGSGSTSTVQGDTASGSADAGNPVKVGGRARNTPNFVAENQRIDAWWLTSGALSVSVGAPTGAPDGYPNFLIFPNNPSLNTSYPLGTAAMLFDGTSLYQQRGNTTGTFVVPGMLPAGTDRSGTAGTTATTLAVANTARRKLLIQNVGTGNIGVNQVGGTAAIGTAGTHTIPANGSIEVTTNRAISVIAASAGTPYTAVEI